MKTLGEVKNRGYSTILMVRPKKATLTTDGSKPVLEISIADDCYVATNREERREFSYHPEEIQEELSDAISYFKRTGKEVDLTPYGLNFVAGGLFFTTPEFGIVIKRDEKAPSHPGYFTICSGIARELKEILYPRLVGVREGCEEVLIFEDDTLYVPVINFPSDSASRNLKSRQSKKDLERIVKHQAREIGIKNVRTKYIETQHIPGEEVLRVFYNNKKVSEIRNTGICIDPKIGNVDVVDVILLDINPSDLVIRDGELDSEGRILDREIYIIRIEDLIENRKNEEIRIVGDEPICYFKSGKVHRSNIIKAPGYTPPLRRAIEVMYSALIQ